MPELTVQELREMLVASAPPSQQSSVERREIVIADRGWVFVGLVTVAPSGDVSIRDAATVRVWGTTRGLGQLALDGPQVNTKLDPCGSVMVPSSSIVARLSCAAESWR